MCRQLYDRKPHRPAPNGRVFIAAGDNQIYGAGEALKKAAPASVVGFGLAPEAVEALNAELGVKMTLVDEIPSGVQFDDIFLCNLPAEFAEPAAKLGSRGAVTSFIGDYAGRSGMFDVGRIHYEGFFYQGAPGPSCRQPTAGMSAAK